MTGARYVAAWAAAVALLVPLSVAARQFRRRWFPGLAGPVARLAESVLVITLLVSLGQLLGTVGAFRLAPLIVSACVVCALCLALAPSPMTGGVDQLIPQPARAGRADVRLATAAVGFACLSFVATTLASLGRGVTEYDSNWYHLPIAAGFVQVGWTTRLHFTGSVPTTYFPANSELLHGIGMHLTGSDILSPVLNLGWLALAFLAAWCIGLRVGRPGLSVLALSVVVSLPIMAYSQAGTAGADLPGVAMLLATIALIVHADQEGQGLRLLLLGAAAAGVLVGIKVVYLPIVAALVVVVLVTVPKARRRPHLIRGFAILTATGAFWYVRNLARAGSPLPSAPLRLGGFGFARVADGAADCGTRSVASYASDPSIWRSDFAPMLRYWFGPLWWLMLLATASVLCGALLWGRDAMSRPLAFTGLVATGSYLLTPATAGGPAGDPRCFGFNTRFLLPTLVLGALTLVLGARSAAAHRGAGVVLRGMLVMTQWSSVRLNAGPGRRGDAVGALLVAAAGLTWLVLERWKPKRTAAWIAAASLALVAVAGAGWIPWSTWPERRSTGEGLTANLGSLPAWADASPGTRIAVVGFAEQWPLYGWHLDNVVRLPVVENQRGALRSPSDCNSWRRSLRSGGFDRVVILSEDPVTAGAELRWIAGDAAATLIPVDGTVAAVYRFDATVPAAPCDL